MEKATKNGARGSPAGRPRLSEFARRLLVEWRRRGWPEREARFVVAVSGGADSMALLLALDEVVRAGRLRLSLTVAHINHGLRGEDGAEDARWVEGRAGALGLEAVVGRADVRGRALARKDNLEQAARRARYEFLEETARGRGAWAVLTAHTLDDQAETIMLRLVRGSGAEGLAGIRPERPLAEEAAGSLAEAGVKLLRPLVAWARRAETEKYCRERGVTFRRDEMNEDEGFARVRVRRRLLPLLETLNPRVVEALARTAELLGDDAAALDAEAAALLDAARTTPPGGGGKGSRKRAAEADQERAAGASGAREGANGAWPLRADVLAAAHAAVRRRALRLWLARGRGGLRRLGLVHVVAVERLTEGVRGGRVAELPGGGRVERRGGSLSFYGKGAGDARTGSGENRLKKAHPAFRIEDSD